MKGPALQVLIVSLNIVGAACFLTGGILALLGLLK